MPQVRSKQLYSHSLRRFLPEAFSEWQGPRFRLPLRKGRKHNIFHNRNTVAGTSTFVQPNCLQFVSHSCFFQEKPHYKYTDDCDQNACMKTGCPDQGSKLYGFVNFRRLWNISSRVHQKRTDCIAKKINCNIVQHDSDNNFGNIEFRFAHCCDL